MVGAAIHMLAIIAAGVVSAAVAGNTSEVPVKAVDAGVDYGNCHAPVAGVVEQPELAEHAVASLLQTRGHLVARPPTASLASRAGEVPSIDSQSWARRLERLHLNVSLEDALAAASSTLGGTRPQCGEGAPDCSTDADLSGVGCSLTACCDQICAVDPFCCNVGWDEVCRNRAMVECAPEPLRNPACGPQVAQNSCNSASSDPGCSDIICCSIVCTQVRPRCCSSSWSSDCVDDAGFFCVGV